MAESSHSSLKAYLMFGTGDLATVFRKLQLFWSAQARELSLEREKRLNKVAFSLQVNIFQEIKSKVVTQAAQIIERELRTLPKRASARAPLRPLTPAEAVCGDACNRLNIVMGLPCRHLLYPYVRDCEPLQMAEISVHWWWHRPALLAAAAAGEDHRGSGDDPGPPSPSPPSSDIREPAIIRGKGRPRGSVATQGTTKGRNRGAHGTRRIPSALENAEADEIAEALAAPPSTAPPMLQSSTRRGPRLHQDVTRRRRTPTPSPSPSPSPVRGGDDDPYEPGTAAPRRSARYITSLEDDVEEEDSDTAQTDDEHEDGLISAYLEGPLDTRIHADEQDELAAQDDEEIHSCIEVAM